MERAIGGKGLISHIAGGSEPPPTDDPGYAKWQQRDHSCFNWIISNLESSLRNEVSQYKTARDLWEGLAITYGSGADPFQVHDLHRQAMAMKQGDMSLESLWNKFQDLWISIDARDPNPMESPKSIDKYNKHTQRHRLNQFIWALDDKYDKIRREILNTDPLPSVRKAYGMVRREAVNEKVLKPEPDQSGIATGLGAIHRNRPNPLQTTRFPPNRKHEEDKSKLTCSHCGGKRHTQETCFHLHGYPEWWQEMKRSRQNQRRNGSGGGRAAFASTGGDRASYAEGVAGSLGNNLSAATPSPDQPNTDGIVSSTCTPTGGAHPTNTAKASISISKNWTEGKIEFLEKPATEESNKGGGTASVEAADSDGVKAGVENRGTAERNGAAWVGNWGKMGRREFSTPKPLTLQTTPHTFLICKIYPIQKGLPK